MARVQVDVVERPSPIKPRPEGVPVHITAIEWMEPSEEGKNPYVKVIAKQIIDEEGVSGQVSFNLTNPFSNEQYIAQNIAKYLMLFKSLSGRDIQKEEDALGGYEDTFEAFFKSMQSYLPQNWNTIPCNLFICYPIKDDVVAKYLNIPTVGNYINSTLRPEPLAAFNPQYHSMEPGSGDDKPEVRTAIGAGNAAKPVRKF